MDRLESDLKKCLQLMSPDWKKQSNAQDRETNFIYKAQTLKECLELIQINGVDEQYALHRWYNYKTSVKCEYLFCEFGAIHEEDEYNHDIDIYVDDVSYDVKLTVYPAKLSERPYDLTTRAGKNAMIEWYYANQSQEARKQLVNRLYVVCDGDSAYENLQMKSDFEILRKKISAFMRNARTNGLNRVTVTDNGRKYTLYSDLIYIHY